MTVLHEYLGPKSFLLPRRTSVQALKRLVREETGLPESEQRLTLRGRTLDDGVEIGELLPPSCAEVCLRLEGRGLRAGGRFGQTTPPLVEFLKDILRRYPEGGQILKELIQNAEDAGATEVRFMYDETEYGVESLWSPAMAQHQGTALYVYNDAVFTAEDWNGIQEIARSRKREDPLKVGRFGIGFNSVYHITDVPSIFSGDQIAMLDPHQTLFGVNESGQCWNLGTDAKEIAELSDQFSPHFGVFGSSAKTLSDGSFPGTLFRFPLRTAPSQLSSNIYSKEKVLELFESFKADADTVLLFLKSVRNISLHVRESDGTERLLYRVTAAERVNDEQEWPEALKALGEATDAYSNGVQSSSTTCVTYQLHIETQDETSKETQRTAWLVSNGVGGRGMCADLDGLADDLKFMPSVGIALPLTDKDDEEEEGASAGFSGRAFCFLPLPPGEESETGLPVHVSGFFGLTDNRRSIKWREVDQWRDPAALWNELLITTIIPKAYYALIVETVSRVRRRKDQDFPLTPRGTYGAWPDPRRVKSRWKPLLRPLFDELLKEKVIYSLSESWVRADQAVFSELDAEKDICETVIGFLRSSGMQVAQVPAAVDSALAAFSPEEAELKRASPSLLRQVVRKHRHKGPAEEKLQLLEFALSDANYSDLIGLELLPLQDQSFAAFTSSVSEKDVVYIATNEYPRSLYPGLESRFVLDTIKPSVMDRLKKAAKSRVQQYLWGCSGRPCTQLQVLTPERSSRLIKEILSKAWPNRDFTVQWEPANLELKHPTTAWLRMVWKHLYIKFSDDLSAFDDMPLIPLAPLHDDAKSATLLRLKTPSPVVHVNEEEAGVSESLLNIMDKLGIKVIKKLDSCLQHPQLKNYIHPLSPAVLLQNMDRLSTQRLATLVSSFPTKEKIALRTFLAGLSDVTEREKHALLELSIFEKVGSSSEGGVSKYMSLRGARALHHRAKYPPDVKLSINLVSCRDEESIRLVKMMNVELVKTTDCLKVIVQDVERGYYQTDDTNQIMLWALKHLAFLKNENSAVIAWLSKIKFIQLPCGKSVAASDLFDPGLEILQNLFFMEEKTKFPPSAYTSTPDILHSLRQLGLRNEVQLSEKDVLNVAKKIEELQSKKEPDWDAVTRKAKTLLQILNKQTKLIKSADVQTSLLKLKWVAVCKERPPTYPKSLAWVGDRLNICSFFEMCDMSHAVLVGSSVALVEHTSGGMKKSLKLKLDPQVDQVLQHLKAVNTWHKSQAFTTEDWYQFQQILFEIYGFMQAHLEDAREALKSLSFDWVWTGKTFSVPGKTVLKPLPDLDLQPYLYSLPKTIRKFHKLFKFCGSIEEVLSSHVFDVISCVQKQCQEGDLTNTESKHNVLLLINILRWLYNNQIPVDTDMHVPILCYKNPKKLAMKPIHECTYCDIKVDDLNDILEDASEPITLVHDDIPMKTAEWLKVPCLSTRLINPENLGFEQSGQREPLTVRIKNILEEYPSVADIFKELLQNADDASATECSFLIDMRKNMDIRENLLDPGMIACHGPSLWSFNNSVFTDTDFLNITRLGGSIKRCEADKVGKFGLGFNSVYHITDIPIIMSREFMIMFDPNINHISKHIRDPSNPGIKINWSKQQKRLRKFPNQFKPFINVFNCQLPLAQDSPYKFNGTLFRLPFRTEQEASVSEISTFYYNTTDIYSLVDEFSLCGHRFILFTQHVGSMVLKYLKYEEPSPSAAQDVVTINKSVWTSKASYGPLSILKSAAKVMKKAASTNKVPADAPKSGCIIRVVVEEFHNVFKRIVDLHSPLFRGSEEDPNQYFEMAAKGIQTKRLTDDMPQKAVEVTNWLIASCMDVSEALKFSLSDSGKRLGLVPCGSVAVLLSEEDNRKWTVKTNSTAIGEVFCYLPLRIKTGLPVHINGCFAVTSNRKEIWKTDTKGQWNSIFMRHVIVQAYLSALTMLRIMAENGELLNYSYYAAWPDPGQVHDDFTLISQGVYQEIAKGGDSEQAKIFSDGNMWVSIKSVRFLDDSLLCRQDIGPSAFKIFLKYLKKSGSLELCAVELPDWVKEGFDDAGCRGKLMENTLTEKQFFTDVFFPHIQEIDEELRDPLMQYVLNEKLEDFATILKVTPCIPCSGPQKELVLPSRLIHPEGRVAKLYNADDGRFPEGTAKDYLNPVCLVKLVQLGMVKDDLSWEDITERTESVSELNESNHMSACVRSSILLSLIDEKLKMGDLGEPKLLEKLQSTKFLPFLTRPAGFSLPWHGNNFAPTTMFSSQELFTTEHQDTVCLIKPILNENSPSFKGCGSMSLAVKDCLGLIRKPSVGLVIQQLNKLSQSFDGVTLYQENITNACYKYLHEEMLQDETAKVQIREELKSFNSILVENTYVNPSKVAFYLNFDAAPYLYQLPNKYRNSCRELFETVGVQPSFTVEDFAAVLEILKQQSGQKSLMEENFQLSRRIISEGIWSLIRDKNQEYCQANYGGILLPDSGQTLQPSKSLCYNDCPWIKVRDSTVKYCHADIPREVAVKLGAVPKRHKALERYASNVCFSSLGSEFGQKEKLTSRIKSILNAYPSEKEMLKELLQNADDAKATEIYFVFDPRTHPTDRIFDDKWIPMQGPALCVYNNQPFTEDDIRGIQNLGRGTKEANPGKTGQYGIGFNSVYHITDCPSFISNNDILCIFDPHAQYAPGATSVSPGRMFRDLDSDFRSQFSDVLNLYLGDHFKLERSTMFRFPIRSTEMARFSEICSVSASDRMVQNLLDKLKTDGAELLMFLNHMEKISICQIESSTGDLKVLYSVTAKITDGDRLKRKQFHASVIDSVTKKKQLSAIPAQQITYTLDIEDTEGKLTTWMICNRSGFPDMENVSKSVISAHKNEDITLFPRGGVAACVSHNYKKTHRAFCFLPLSLETGLPFHVNGHFALDSARRNLWRDDNGVGVRSDWNNNLMMSLIAPAFVELLVQLKRRYFPGPDPTVTIIQATPLHAVKDTLRKYLFFFPVNKVDIQADWYCLVKAVYQCIHAEQKRLLPVLRAPHTDNSEMHSVIYISWVNTSPANKGRAYFDNLLQDELHHLKNTEHNVTSRKSVAENVYRLKMLLLDIGFNLVYSCDESANLYLGLEDAGIPVAYVTPKDVTDFLHTFSAPDTSCQIGKLPCRLQQSNYKLVHNVKLLVDYCFKDIEGEDFKIEAQPLLVTMDNMLQVFDLKRPKFLTTHHELIPQRKEMFMNAIYIKYSGVLLKAGAAKAFDISSFGELVGSVLPREYRTKAPVRWRDSFQSESWLKNVWNFISENMAVKEDQSETKPRFDTVVDILKDWALLPGVKFMAREKLVIPEHDLLLPLSLMNVAIYPQGQNDKVFHTLMKAGCIQLAINKMCAKDNPILPLLAQHTANIENPSSVLKALEYMIQTSAFKSIHLTDKDFEALLLYFNCNLANLLQEDVPSLKLLPCFKSVSGRYISIANCVSNYVLAKDIPAADIDKWAHNTTYGFLADNPQLKDLYTFLGCTPIDDLEIYLQHLLPKFENLTHSAKVEHIVYLKERLLSIEESCKAKNQLFEKLEGLSFIYDSSTRLRQAKFFFDKTVAVFEVMLPLKAFIPNDFFRKVEQISKPKNGALQLSSWITFLRSIGLKHDVSQLQILQFAKEISIKSQTENWTKEKVQTTVDVLLNHIFKERVDLFQGNFLKELSMIPFLCPERAPKELVKLHPQYQEVGGSLPLIRFSGSQVNPKFKQTDIINLLWTSCPILPEKATPSSINDQEGNKLSGQEQLDQILNMLSVNLDPSLEKVITNCKNICNISSPDDEMVKTRNKVLRSTYEFLSAEKKEFRFHLRGVPFIIVEDGWKLLKPEEVVINLDNESDFKPYLYKLPLELGTFHQLFKLLGTEDVVSTKQFVEVLGRIYRSSEGKQLDPNEMRTVKRAVSGLFKSLHNDPVEMRKDLENLRDLIFYLPSHDGRLVKSNGLVFDDAPHYKSRIQGNVGVQMLVDMSQCYLGKDYAFHTKLIMLLPQKLRPRLLSSILEEQLDEDSPKMCQFGALCSLQGRLQLLLSSEQFITGLIRIMKHENENAYLVNEEKALRLCKALSEGLKVSCFEKLQTTLRVKGCAPIPNSRSETLAFLKRYGTSVIHLYIQHSDSKDINFLLALAMTLKSATDNLISDTSYLIAMLGCNDIYRITEKLDNLGVKYDSTEPSKLELPLPGTPIPAEIHHTLLMDPMNVFYPGEYVGYLVDSEGGDIYGSYQPTYTYAIIVQEVEKEEEENSGFLGKCFQIDIGYSEYKIVSSLDLYKFSRQDENAQVRDTGSPSTPTSPDIRLPSSLRMMPPMFTGKENLRPPPQKQSPKKIKLHALPEILKEVTLVIEQAWKLPETERKKIIRRLYLKWHPDKNAENLDAATEVFKHLQNEISRMEKQSLADQQNTERASRRSYSTSSTRYQSEKHSYQRFYSTWNQEATSHRSERQQFREHNQSHAGSSHSHRFFVPPTFKTVGNPVEARRWLRQARANYSAARNDLHKNANEWVCFKCYLATKLALIAADYAVRGKSDKDVKPTALAQKVEEYNSQLAGLASDVQILDGYGVDSLRTRYPDLLPFPQIPNDRFTSEVAMRVMECTARIIIKLETFVQQKV